MVCGFDVIELLCCDNLVFSWCFVVDVCLLSVISVCFVVLDLLGMSLVILVVCGCLGLVLWEFGGFVWF